MVADVAWIRCKLLRLVTRCYARVRSFGLDKATAKHDTRVDKEIGATGELVVCRLLSRQTPSYTYAPKGGAYLLYADVNQVVNSRQPPPRPDYRVVRRLDLPAPPRSENAARNEARQTARSVLPNETEAPRLDLPDPPRKRTPHAKKCT